MYEYQGKYGDVIGQKCFFLYVPSTVTVSRLDFFSQSQRRIYPDTSNHEISPNNSVYYSGWHPPALGIIF
jgi:hypothetical protein